MPNVHFQSSRVAIQIGPAVPTPALLKSRWHAPKRPYADVATCSMLSALETSLRNVRDCVPGRSSATVAARPPSSMSVRTTFMPSSAQRIANSRPNPLAAPVMTATFSRSSFIPVLTALPRYSAGLKRRAYFVDALLDAGVDHIENLRLRLAVGLGQGPHGTERLFDGLLGHLGRLRRRTAVLRHALQLRSNLAQNRLQHFRLLVRNRLDAIECNLVGLDDRLEVLAAAFHDRQQIDVWQLQLVHDLVEVDNGKLRLVHAWSLSIELTSEDYIRGRRPRQDAVASPPMGCPTDAVFLASAMKLRAAKNNETQVKAIASGTTSVIADCNPTARNASVISLVPAAVIACFAYISDSAPVTTVPKPAPRTY